MQPRRYLSGGLTLTADERAAVTRKLVEIEGYVEVSPSREVKEATLGLIGKMLMAYPMASSSAENGMARGEAYLAALDDVPPWAIAEAIRKWHRGEGGGRDSNYRFAPAPAELRFAAMQILQPAKQTIAHLEAVLNALTIERAMDPTPIISEIPTARPRLRAL